MLTRCYNKARGTYPHYGGRGIVVCDAWRTDFAQFFSDMGPAPAKCTIERIDNNGPYSRENCRWAPMKDQCRNQRSNFLVIFNGNAKPLIDWAESLNLNYHTLHNRLSKGWTPQRAFETPCSAFSGLSDRRTRMSCTKCDLFGNPVAF